jgi:hypothetical protein
MWRSGTDAGVKTCSPISVHRPWPGPVAVAESRWARVILELWSISDQQSKITAIAGREDPFPINAHRK